MEQPVKRKRRADIASLLLSLATAVVIFVYGFKKDKIIEYIAENDPSTTQLAAMKNGTIKCYRRTEKKTYPVLLHFVLGLLAMILGTFVHCSLLVVEEICHLRSRYNGDMRKLWQACFSGISWAAVIVATTIVVITLAITFRHGTLELTYLVIAAGLCPIVTHLMILPTKSNIFISTVLEEKESHVGQILAWSYYFDYLRKTLPKFQYRVSIQVQDEQVWPSLDALILLVSLDCTFTENLEYHDSNIKKIGEIFEGKFPVYRLRWYGNEYKYAITYATQPLETLYQMSQYANTSLALQQSELEYQVKFFYRKLSKILEAPLDMECRGKCILVPITVKSVESLQSGGLVNVIMNAVKASKPQCFVSDFLKTDTYKSKADEYEHYNRAPSNSPWPNLCLPNFEERKEKYCSKDSEKTGLHKVEAGQPNDDKDSVRMGSSEFKAVEQRYKDIVSELDVIEVDV